MSRRIGFFLFIAAILLSPGCGRGGHVPPSESVALPHAVNINTAPTEELQKIPHVGEVLAARIVAYRELHGPFRRVEHLMLIDGISDKRFRKIRPLVRIE